MRVGAQAQAVGAEDTAASAATAIAPLAIPQAEALTQAEMQAYTDRIDNSDATFEMVPIPGGTFRMGSPDSEAGRKDDEGPLREIKVEPFWMGKCEVTWDEYEIFMFNLDGARRKLNEVEPTQLESAADALTRPTKPYTDMSFGMGKKRFPAICMTQYAAKKYCEWLSAKTGRFYRLPTEAEWEYACRAGTDTAYYFGDDPALLDEHGWSYDNSDETYHPVGGKQPNPWGLFDMHGNVAEWCADQYLKDAYSTPSGDGPCFVVPEKVEPCVVRGGSWDDDPEALRSAARRASHKDWKQQDPQLPQSVWYYTDALFVGFRVVRPLVEPPLEERAKYGAEDLTITNHQ